MRDERWEMRDARWEMRDERWEMRDERSEMRDQRWGQVTKWQLAQITILIIFFLHPTPIKIPIIYSQSQINTSTFDYTITTFSRHYIFRLKSSGIITYQITLLFCKTNSNNPKLINRSVKDAILNKMAFRKSSKYLVALRILFLFFSK